MASAGCINRFAMPALATFLAGAGIILFMVAIPVAVSGFLASSGDITAKRIQKERVVNESELRHLIRSLETASQWRKTADIYYELSLGYLILGNYIDSENHLKNLDLVEEALNQGLVLAPMNPYGWMRLVQVRKKQGASVSEIARPLQLMIRSGSHETPRHAMLLLMIETGLQVWNELNDYERGIITQKAQAGWNRDPRGTARVAVRVERSDLLASLLGL